jgi:hypothetical protein
MENKEAHVGKMEKRLKRLGARLDELAAKAGEAGTEIKVDYRQHLDDLKTQHREVRTKLEELKAASGREWESFKAGVDSAGRELEAAFRKMAE